MISIQFSFFPITHIISAAQLQGGLKLNSEDLKRVGDLYTENIAPLIHNIFSKETCQQVQQREWKRLFEHIIFHLQQYLNGENAKATAYLACGIYAQTLALNVGNIPAEYLSICQPTQMMQRNSTTRHIVSFPLIKETGLPAKMALENIFLLVWSDAKDIIPLNTLEMLAEELGLRLQNIYMEQCLGTIPSSPEPSPLPSIYGNSEWIAKIHSYSIEATKKGEEKLALQFLLKKIIDLVGGERGFIYVEGWQNEEMVEISVNFEDTNEITQISHSTIREVLVNGQVFIKTLEFSPTRSMQENHLTAVISYPLYLTTQSQDEKSPQGVIYIDSSSAQLLGQSNQEIVSLLKNYVEFFFTLYHMKQEHRRLKAAKGPSAKTIYQDTQKIMEPVVPSGEDLAIGYAQQPYEEVGGDYVDFLHTGKEILIFLGDVVNKGPRAHFIAATVKGLTQAVFSAPFSSTELLKVQLCIRLANFRKLYRTCIASKIQLNMMSLAILVYSCQARQFLYNSGGQGELLKYNGKSKTFEWIGQKGIVYCQLSLEKTYPWALLADPVLCDVGDILFLFSDGFSEAFLFDNKNTDTQWKQKLEIFVSDILKSAPESPYQTPNEFARKILCNVKKEIDRHHHNMKDDMSIVCISRKC